MSERRPLDDLLGAAYSTTVVEAAILVREVRIRVGVLPAPVTIRIFYDPRQLEPYFCELSSAMRPPGSPAQEPPPSRASSEAEALRRAVHALTDAYEQAVRSGHLPEERWLVCGDLSR